MTKEEIDQYDEVNCVRCSRYREKALFMECKECVEFYHQQCVEAIVNSTTVVWCGTG
jgi:hypothetical protein